MVGKTANFLTDTKSQARGVFGLAVSTVAAQLNAALYSQLYRHKVEQTMKRGI